MKVLIVIPARSGSKGIPRKNLVEVGGLSLVGRAVLTARQFVRRAGLDAAILVDTDSEEIAAEGRRWGATVPFLRPPELATDATPTIDNVRLAIDRISRANGAVDVVVVLQPSSPLRTADDVAACWAQFDSRTAPSVISISAYPHPIEYALRLAPGGTVQWAGGSPPHGSRRQDFEPCFSPNGGVYIAAAELLARQSFLIPGVTRGVVTSPERSPDLDTLEDLAVIRAVAERTPVPSVRCGTKEFGPRSRCFVIAEMQDASAERPEQVLRLLDLAAAAGADAVDLSFMVWGGSDEVTWRALIRHAENAGMIPIVLARDETSVECLTRAGVAAFVVKLQDVENPTLAVVLARVGKPVLMSVGTAGLGEVVDAVEALRSQGSRAVALMCEETSPYPMGTFRFMVGAPVGWRAEDGSDTSAAAVCAGAQLLAVPLGDELGDVVAAVRRAETTLVGRALRDA